MQQHEYIPSFFSIAGRKKRGWANVWLCKVECYCVFLLLLFSYIRWYVSSLAAIIEDIENKGVKKLSSTFSFLFSTFFIIFSLKVNYEIEVYNCVCCICILNSQHFRLPLLFFFVGDHHSFACGGGGGAVFSAAADLISLPPSSLLSPQWGAKPPSQEIKWASSLLLSLFWEGNGRESHLHRTIFPQSPLPSLPCAIDTLPGQRNSPKTMLKIAWNSLKTRNIVESWPFVFGFSQPAG